MKKGRISNTARQLDAVGVNVGSVLPDASKTTIRSFSPSTLDSTLSGSGPVIPEPDILSRHAADDTGLVVADLCADIERSLMARHLSDIVTSGATALTALNAAISVVGLGPGNSDYLTPRAAQLIEACDVLIGSPRQLACFPAFRGAKRPLDASLPSLAAWLAAHQWQSVVVLASGDPMLYGIGDFLSRHLPAGSLCIVPGISAAQYLFSRLGWSMNDVYLTSSHGRRPDFEFLLRHRKVAMMTDRIIGPYEIAREIITRNLRRTLVIGENLSYPDERIHILPPEEVARNYAMNVVVILDER